MKSIFKRLVLIGVLLIPLTSFALTLPYTFVNNTVADADQVNANFSALLNVTNGVTALTTPQINDTSSDHQYVFAVNELAADRTVTLPLLTGNDTFVFNDHTQTLTNKTLTSPTINSPTISSPVLSGGISGVLDLYGGVDLRVYSDSGSSLQASIDGATGGIIGLNGGAGQVSNCEMGVSGSTFTISGDGGAALSATNPCLVRVRSTTAGRVAIARFNSNVTFTFGSSSDTDGNSFGVTSGADWANYMPFFVGVIYNGTTPYFVISRAPYTHTEGANADFAASGLCQKADTSCDGVNAKMILATGLTLTSFYDLPITPVGWFFMTYATSGSAWTASLSQSFTSRLADTITSKEAGFNKEYEKLDFTFPQGQVGAASGSHLLANGGTVPQFSTELYLYRVYSNGECSTAITYTGDAGTDGSGGAAQFGFAIPLDSSNSGMVGDFTISNPGGAYFPYVYNGSGIYFKRPTYSGSNLQNAITDAFNGDFTNGSRTVGGSVKYGCYTD